MSKLIDTELLLDLVGEDRDSFMPIIEDFHENGQKLLLEIAQGTADSDLSIVKAAAHQLKGSSGMLSMTALFEFCKEVETLELTQISEEFLQQFNACFVQSVSAAREVLS